VLQEEGRATEARTRFRGILVRPGEILEVGTFALP
jgi:hypothetical protein